MCILLLKKKYTILTGLCLVWEIFLMSDRALAEDKRENSPILIISSYNPETFPAVLPATSPTLWRSSNAWAGQTPSHWRT